MAHMKGKKKISVSAAVVERIKNLVKKGPFTVDTITERVAVLHRAKVLRDSGVIAFKVHTSKTDDNKFIVTAIPQ